MIKNKYGDLSKGGTLITRELDKMYITEEKLRVNEINITEIVTSMLNTQFYVDWNEKENALESIEEVIK